MKIKLTSRQYQSIINEHIKSLNESSIKLAPEYQTKLDSMMKLYSGIHADNVSSQEIIKNVLGNLRFNIGEDISFTYKGLTDKLGINENSSYTDRLRLAKIYLRFNEYFHRFKWTKNGRGWVFEGFIAGLMGGNVIGSKGEISDVEVNNTKYSLKLLDRIDTDRFDMGSIKTQLGDRDINTVNIVDILQQKFTADNVDYFILGRVDKDSNMIAYSVISRDDFINIAKGELNMANTHLGPGKRTNSVGLYMDFIKKSLDDTTKKVLNDNVKTIKFEQIENVIDKIYGLLYDYKEESEFLTDVRDALFNIDDENNDPNLRQEILQDKEFLQKYLRPEILYYIKKHKDKISQNLQNISSNK